MALFRYEATDKTGRIVRGVMNARDEREVAQNLSAMGYTPSGVYGSGGPATATQSQPAAVPKTAQAAVSASGVPTSIRSKVPAQQLGRFFRQLVTLVRAGTPLYQSITGLAPAVRNRHLRRTIPSIQMELQSGRALSGAMAQFPQVFPTHAVASVWCGELSGRLDVILEEVASDFEREASETRVSRLGWVLTKIAIAVMVLTYPLNDVGKFLDPIISGQGTMSTDWTVQLRYYLKLGLNEMLHKGLPVMLAILVVWFVWERVKRIPSVRRVLDGLLIHVPVWGKLHRYRSLARFTLLLEHLYSAGVNPSTAWDAASMSPRNNEIAARLRQARSKESPVAGIGQLVATAGVLEPEDAALITMGEKTGQVPTTLANLYNAYVNKADAQRSLGRVLSVSAFITSQLIIGGIAIIAQAMSYARAINALLQFVTT